MSIVKLSICILLSVVTVSTFAQSAITKPSIVGKWRVATINMEGLMFYNVDKDSLEFISQSFRDILLATTTSSSLDSIKSNFKSAYFKFETDGTFSTGDGMKANDFNGYYYVEETKNALLLNPLKGKSLPEELVNAKKSLRDNLLVIEFSNNGKRLITEFVKYQ